MIVKVGYIGRFGNNLFQYAFSRLLAERMGYGINKYEGKFSEVLDGCKDVIKPKIDKIKNPGLMQILKGHEIDIDKVIEAGGIIWTKGFFQRYEYYKYHRHKLKEWFRLPEIDFEPNEKDIVLHIRRSDFSIGNNVLSFGWYHKILQNGIDWNKIYITGGCNQMETENDIDQVVIKEFERYNPIYIDKDPIITFQMIQRFTNIVQSQSSFVWWAAFLSEYAERVYTPIPLDGYWSDKRSDIDLIINDYSRYINLKQGVDW